MLKNHIAFQHLYQIPSAICVGGLWGDTYIASWAVYKGVIPGYTFLITHPCQCPALTKEKVKKGYQIGLAGGQVRSLSYLLLLLFSIIMFLLQSSRHLHKVMVKLKTCIVFTL